MNRVRALALALGLGLALVHAPGAAAAPDVVAAPPPRDVVAAPPPRDVVAAPPPASCTTDGALCIAAASYVADVCGAIEALSLRHGLDPHFFARVLWKESLFDAGAVSPAGAQGIAQFMPDTARLRGLADRIYRRSVWRWPDRGHRRDLCLNGFAGDQCLYQEL